MVVAEQAQRFSTIGIDCVAMNVNDLICVGAEPLALLDYLAVESADPSLLAELAEGLRAGAEDAGVEIPGGDALAASWAIQRLRVSLTLLGLKPAIRPAPLNSTKRAAFQSFVAKLRLFSTSCGPSLMSWPCCAAREREAQRIGAV